MVDGIRVSAHRVLPLLGVGAMGLCLVWLAAACGFPELPTGGDDGEPPTLELLAGNSDGLGSVDGTGGAARFNFPLGVTVDRAGNVYVADTNNATIRKITPTGPRRPWPGWPA